MQNDIRNFTPISTFGISVKQTQVGDKMLLIIASENGLDRSGIGHRRIEWRLVHGFALSKFNVHDCISSNDRWSDMTPVPWVLPRLEENYNPLPYRWPEAYDLNGVELISWMEIRKVLALNLRKCRQAKGLSQEELADRAKVDRTYVSAIERSVYAATIDVVDRLARGLGVEAADLLRRPPGPRTVGKGEWLGGCCGCLGTELGLLAAGRNVAGPAGRKQD
jgi:DNA-binding XRE family transcriptional regulator